MTDHQPNECPYKVDLPYPPVRMDGPNPIYACEMLSNMAKVVSEMSDVSRYLYIATETKEQSSGISACFHHIGIVEMHHLTCLPNLHGCLGQIRASGVVGHASAGGSLRLSVAHASCVS